MRVAVLGAGAIGGWLAAALAAAGCDVAVLARGATLAALRAEGLRLETATGGESHAVLATDDPRAIAGRDLLLLGLKGHDVPPARDSVAALLGPGTCVLSVQNGLPWWFLSGIGGPAEGWTLESVDPAGHLAALLPAHRTLAAVVHATARVVAPGVIRLIGQDRLLVGDPAGSLGGLRDGLLALLRAGGVNAEPTPDIRGEIWRKLWGNASMNPLSALARADTAALLDTPAVAAVAVAMMREMASIGDRIGLPMGQSPDERIGVTRRLGAIRTSMLADLEAGRPLERGPILACLVELAARLGVAVPMLAGIDGLLCLLGRAPPNAAPTGALQANGLGEHGR